MHKTYFHNSLNKIENKEEKKSTTLEYIEKKRNVDINKLLNRVKENEKKEFIKKITLLSIGTLILSIFGIITIF